jgi:hypothetical protein
MEDVIYDTVIMRACRQDILRAGILHYYHTTLTPLATVPLGTETASAAPLFRDSFQLTNRPANFRRVARVWCVCVWDEKKEEVELPMIVGAMRAPRMEGQIGVGNGIVDQ